MTLTPPLLVAGLPYSGGGVAAEALHRAGLPLGGPFLPIADRDAVGAFVDREIHAWHERWLRADVPEPALAELDALLGRRFAGAPAWGVRSPHALAMRRVWRRRFPDARWLFVTRAPAVQVASCISRTPPDRVGLPRSPLGRALRELRRWRAGHTAVLELARGESRRVVIVDAGRFAGASAAFDRALREGWELPIDPVDLDAAFRPHLLRRRGPAWIRALALLTPGVSATWRQLQRLALPSTPPVPPVGPRIAVASHWRFTPSESFIQEQLRRLPGEVHFLHRQHETWFDRDARPIAGLVSRIGSAVGRELGFDVDGADSRALRRYLRRHRIDCLLANFGRVALAATDACREARVPLVAHFHGADAHRERPAPGSALYYAPVFAQATAIVAVSRPMIERLVELGAPRDRVLLNPCGVDLDEFAPGHPAAAPPRFVAAGRFVGKKGPMLTLLAFERVLRRRPDARLTMLGDGVLRDPCERLAKALGLEDRVEFSGAFAHGELGSRLRGARAFLQHSLRQGDGDSEGLPVAILEASASGLPVISTRHAGIPQAVVDGETGLLGDEGDVDAMAESMLRLADEPELAADMGRRARRHVGRHFPLERTLGRLAEILLAAASGGPLPVVDHLAVTAEAVGEEPAPLAVGRLEELAQ